MILKPTIRDGEWVYLPPPPQDAKYLATHPLIKETSRVSTSR